MVPCTGEKNSLKLGGERRSLSGQRFRAARRINFACVGKVARVSFSPSQSACSPAELGGPFWIPTPYQGTARGFGSSPASPPVSPALGSTTQCLRRRRGGGRSTRNSKCSFGGAPAAAKTPWQNISNYAKARAVSTLTFLAFLPCCLVRSARQE